MARKPAEKTQIARVCLTPEQLERIDRMAERIDVTRSQFLRMAAIQKVAQLEQRLEKTAK